MGANRIALLDGFFGARDENRASLLRVCFAPVEIDGVNNTLARVCGELIKSVSGNKAC